MQQVPQSVTVSVLRLHRKHVDEYPLPTIDSATRVATTFRRPQIDWTTVAGGSLASADGGAVSVHWSEAGTGDYGWMIVVAPGTTTVTAPALPTAFDAWAPHGAVGPATASMFLDPEVTFVASDVIAGYAAFRRDAGRILPITGTSDKDARAVLPVNGTIRSTTFKNPAL